MHRSKNLALMFLLGALLLGGVLGFTAERFLVRDARCPKWWNQQAMRQRLADELDLTPVQRAAVDSILDRRRARIDSVMRPVRPQLDAIGESTRQQIARLLEPAQRAKYDAMDQKMTRTRRKDAR